MKSRTKKLGYSPACHLRMLARFGFLNIIFILLLALSIQSQAAKVEASKPIEKILSLDLCTDWMLATYADPSQVLALSPLLDQYPVDWMKREWPSHDGSLEQILELNPDEILSLPKNFSEVDLYEQRLLSLICKPLTLNKTDKLLQASSNRQSYSKRKPKLLLLGPNGIGTGRGTFEDDLLQHTGWNNYLTSEGYSNLDLEQIVTHPPDAILWSTSDSAALANLFAKHPVLRQVISKDRWLSTDDWRWHCPGPWSKKLIKQLQAQLEEQF